MADAMVTGRMSKSKKEAGNRVLESLGVTASQAINELYTYLIDKKHLPFDSNDREKPTRKQVEDAFRFVDSIPLTNGFSTMSYEEIQATKLRMLLDS